MGGPHGVGCHNRTVKIGTGGFQPDAIGPFVVILCIYWQKIVAAK